MTKTGRRDENIYFWRNLINNVFMWRWVGRGDHKHNRTGHRRRSYIREANKTWLRRLSERIVNLLSVLLHRAAPLWCFIVLRSHSVRRNFIMSRLKVRRAWTSHEHLFYWLTDSISCHVLLLSRGRASGPALVDTLAHVGLGVHWTITKHTKILKRWFDRQARELRHNSR